MFLCFFLLTSDIEFSAVLAFVMTFGIVLGDLVKDALERSKKHTWGELSG